MFAFHGTPGSRTQLAFDEATVTTAGVRFICLDRPGYGFSTFQPRRRLTEWPRDVEHLADHLGISSFAVLGASGGGPHAAVCGALLGERVRGVSIVSGVGPLANPDVRASLGKGMQQVAKLATRRSPVLTALLRLQSEASRRWPAKAFDTSLRRLPASDIDILTRPAIRHVMEQSAVNASRTVSRAQAQDFELFASDWGFDLGSIAAPVHLWQGDADTVVPPLHADVLHRSIPQSTLRTVPGGGHFLIIDYLSEILEELRGP